MTLPSDPGARHIPLPADDDWYAPDEHLRWLVRRSVGEAIWPVAESALQDAGRLSPTVLEPLAAQADRHPPILHQFNARGERIDEIEFHPAYKEIERTVLGFGSVRMGYASGWRGLQGRAPRPLVSAVHYLFLQADQAITGCPIGMMDAGARALQRNDPALAARFVPRLTDDTGNHMTMAMFLTEKAGGSDVGANETVAVRQDDGTYRLTGEKWFASCAHSDLVLVMARPEGAGAGSRGLGLFLMPRMLPDGTRNSYVLHRLKDKYGTRAMASSELGLREAFAWPVGDIGRGMKQMLDMVNLTRVGIATATAGSMRRSAHESLTHARLRSTFGRQLALHPMMRDTLAELVVDSTAGLTAAMAVSEAIDRNDAGEPGWDGTWRLLTPLLKMHGTERAVHCAREAMEVRGGNGFIEDWPNSRMLRDVSVHAIWEGPGNIMALDVLRALAHGAGPDFLADLERRAETIAGPGPVAPLSPVLLEQTRRVERDIALLGSLDPDAQQLPMRRLSRRMAMLAIGSRLAEQAREHAAETGSGRLVWLASRYLARLGGDNAIAAVADDATWLPHGDALLYGGPVPPSVGERAARVVAATLRGASQPVGV
ncbi:MAG TPA: acyl-CoA dehydrogenase family protein [Candidatus Dormibacteraeota bacterium]|jgi:alkylation response protein AidB-like acyl-CoA dehydrogenase|nr:acyl-CoA dehydrogenase family protein [Candidatus Dormibacteraeota bacterium]